MNENIHFETYFQTPVYVTELPELIDQLNEASEPHIKYAKEKNKILSKERDKAIGKKIGDLGMSHHSGPLVGLPAFADIQGYVERRSLEIMNHLGYDMTTYDMTWTEMWVQEFSKKGAGYHNAHIHYDPAYLEHEFSVDLGIDPFRFIHFNLQAVRKQEHV